MAKTKYKLKKTNSVKELIDSEKEKEEVKKERRKKIKSKVKPYFFILPIILILIDQFTKYFISISLDIGEEIVLIPGFFNIQYIINRGAALGIFHNRTIFLVLVSSAMIIFLIYMAVRENRLKHSIIPELIIIGGAFGNLIDRVFLEGGVRDFLEVPFFAVMNFADWFVSLGIVLFIIKLIFNTKNEKEVSLENRDIIDE